MRYADRCDAGRGLADAVQHLAAQDVIVCGLPRGGVPVAFEVARSLDVPLDIVVVAKLRFPGQPELAMGAVGEAGARFLDEATVALSGLSAGQLAEVERRAAAEVHSRARRCRDRRERVPLTGRTVVIVDDGIATGSSARAACQVVRAEGAARVVLAVPVAPPGWIDRMGEAADEYVSLQTPEPMVAVGNWYADFSATTEAEVLDCLARSQEWRH